MGYGGVYVECEPADAARKLAKDVRAFIRDSEDIFGLVGQRRVNKREFRKNYDGHFMTLNFWSCFNGVPHFDRIAEVRAVYAGRTGYEENRKGAAHFAEIFVLSYNDVPGISHVIWNGSYATHGSEMEDLGLVVVEEPKPVREHADASDGPPWTLFD